MNTKKTLDQWYTPSDVALQCATIARQYILPSLIIEPSAGEGALVDAARLIFPGVEIQAFDIDPKRADIEQDNFLALIFCNDKPTTLVFANPPFGKRAILAIQFFNRAALLADTLAFIVPLQFRKWSVQSHLDPLMRLVYDTQLPDNTFEGVRCCFQVWKIGGTEPDLRMTSAPAIIHKDFVMWQYNNTRQAAYVFGMTFDFAVPRQGFADYTRRETDQQKCERTTQWILFRAYDPQTLSNLRALDFETLAKKNTTTPGFGKADVVKLYHEVYGDR
jgi:hypothetical protein